MTTQPPDPSAPAAEADAQAETAPSFGWNDYAERLNGRFAMLGFAALLITQFFTRQDFWSWIGL